MPIQTKIRKLKWLSKHKSILKRIIHAGFHSFNESYSLDAEENRLISTIKQSEMFDADWYLRNRFDLKSKGIDPAKHYLYHGVQEGIDPSPRFCTEEYLSLHSDAAKAKQNPLVHYELHGKNEGRIISYLEVKDYEPPEGTEACRKRFRTSLPSTKRTAILSCYLAEGIISDDLVYLIKGLQKVADNIILIGDCQVLPSELDKLEGLVCYAEFERHEQYDFGSYKRGLEYAKKESLLNAYTTQELIFINDSCYGPVFPFEESFKKMADVPCDFWGLTENKTDKRKRYISSYFIVFNKDILDSGELECFLQRVKGSYDRGKVVATLETEMTAFLQSKGFRWALYIDDGPSVFQYPVTLMKKYRLPLVKKKAFLRKSSENLNEAIQIIASNAPDLANTISVKLPHSEHRFISLEEHQNSFKSKCERIFLKTKEGKKIKVLFFICNPSMFPGRPLFERMLEDPLFDAYYVVVPDKRQDTDGCTYYLRKAERSMQALYPADRQIIVRPDELGRWPDVCMGADIVCYPLPYAVSSFRYNPGYSVGRDFLPIIVNYGFYRSKYDCDVMGIANTYPYMWKAFFECEDTLEEYKAYSLIQGKNADLTGYIKMDGLAAKKKKAYDRKRILVALHHSVEGGMNDSLALANIVRYKQFFSDLPKRYPDIDFIYRPHAYLKTVLSKPQFWGEDETNRYFEEIRSYSNVIWDENPDYFDSFCQSDGCIQDCGSFLVEYLYTGNPCCYMLKDPEDIKAKFAPLGQKCLDYCYLSFNADDIDHFIMSVIREGKDIKKKERIEFSKRVMLNYPHAADLALEHIKNAIIKSDKRQAEKDIHSCH